MTNGQKLAFRCSEIRQRLNEISGLEGDAFTDEVRQEADKIGIEYRDTETKYRAALVSEGDDATAAGAQFTPGTVEDRAYRELVGRGNVGSVIEAVVEHRQTVGADAELQKHHGLASNQITLELLRLPREEHRALTPGPTNVGTVESPILLPVFATGAGAFMSIDRPTVPMGDAVFPVLTTRPTVGGPHSDSTDAPETTGAFASNLLAPERLQASFIYKRVDVARFPGMDPSLRTALNEGLEEALDKEAIAGTAGLLTATNLPVNAAESAIKTFPQFLSQFGFSRVDGRYASEVSDVRTVCGAATYALMGATYRADESAMTALGELRSMTGGVRVSAHVPAVATAKQNSVIRLGSRRDMIQPTWAGVTIIVDETTLSGTGEIEITAVLLMNTKILRAGGFHKQESKVA